jgi:YtkA-like
MSPHIVARRAVALAIGIVAGCGGSSSPGDTTDGGVIDCSNDARAMKYAPGLSITSTGKQMKFTLLSSDPAPPARGNDTWKLSIANAAGQPLSGLNVSVLPFMPDHGHGTSVTPTVTANSDATYTVTPLYFFMPGVWQITFGTTPPGGTADTAVYYFCVPG